MSYQSSSSPSSNLLDDDLVLDSEANWDNNDSYKSNPSLFNKMLAYKTHTIIIGFCTVLLVFCLLISISTNSSPVVSKSGELNNVVLVDNSHNKVIDSSDTSICLDPKYTKTTLKTATESSMVALYHNLNGNKKFEASDVIMVGDAYYVVYDNLYSIGRISVDLPFRSDRNVLLGNRTGDSGYEAIVYDEKANLFYVVVESVAKSTTENTDEDDNSDKPGFHANIEEIEMVDSTNEATATIRSKASVSYTRKGKCPCEFEFSAGNKGFEGAVSVRIDDNLFMLGLCEGNYCEGGKRGKEAGNGRVVVMKKVHHKPEDPDDPNSPDCIWKTVKVLNLPETANFVDYSSIAIRPKKDSVQHNEYRIAVTSQESSSVWMGDLIVTSQDNAADWKFTSGNILNFPRNNDCEVVYCNIEGISFVSDSVLVAVSDKMKANNRQPFRCFEKDQSIHVFVMP